MLKQFLHTNLCNRKISDILFFSLSFTDITFRRSLRSIFFYLSRTYNFLRKYSIFYTKRLRDAHPDTVFTSLHYNNKIRFDLIILRLILILPTSTSRNLMQFINKLHVKKYAIWLFLVHCCKPSIRTRVFNYLLNYDGLIF